MLNKLSQMSVFTPKTFTDWNNIEVSNTLSFFYVAFLALVVFASMVIFTSFVRSKPDGRKTVLGNTNTAILFLYKIV